jgi:hypothetical protein
MTARNDPCPCGSGKKYKRCCLGGDEGDRRRLSLQSGGRGRSRAETLNDLATAELPPVWELDAAPIDVRLDDDPAARPAMVLVAAGGLILHVDVVSHPPAEPAEVAVILVAALDAAQAAAARAPALVVVRHESVATALRPLLASTNIVVDRSIDLPEVDAVLAGYDTHVLGMPAREGRYPRIAAPETWAGWALGH